MSAKILWSGVGMVLTLVVIWQAGQAGWVRPPAPRAGSGPAANGPGSPRVRPDSVIAEGRLVTYPGAEVMIATELAGMIVSLPVQEKSVVGKGELIAELKSDELQAASAEALARIEEAEA